MCFYILLGILAPGLPEGVPSNASTSLKDWASSSGRIDGVNYILFGGAVFSVWLWSWYPPWWSRPCHMSLFRCFLLSCCRLLQLSRAHLPVAVSDKSSCHDPNPIEILHRLLTIYLADLADIRRQCLLQRQSEWLQQSTSSLWWKWDTTGATGL